MNLVARTEIVLFGDRLRDSDLIFGSYFRHGNPYRSKDNILATVRRPGFDRHPGKAHDTGVPVSFRPLRLPGHIAEYS